jgi:glycosyltransferase involved in cell wall biosynthesis
MKTTCIVISFNYEKYIVEAVRGALNQSVEFDEIIVVDDCSSDQSIQVLQDNFSNHDRVKLIFKKENEGQLSALNVGFKSSVGDIIFFLDSDDIYCPNYLEEVLKVYKAYPACDFVSTAYTFFGECAPPDLPLESSHLVDDWGYSAANAFYRRSWVGSPTSMISARRSILEKFMPIPFLEEWKVRADDCIIYGVSIVGGRKFRVNQRLVRYRKHNAGAATTLTGDNSYVYTTELKFDRLFTYLHKCSGYSQNLDEIAHLEFQTLPRPKFKELLLYANIISYSTLKFNRKVKRIISLWKHFLKTRKY